MSPEERREKNRREMPNVAAVMDQFTKVFSTARIDGCCEDLETGKKAGKPWDFVELRENESN